MTLSFGGWPGLVRYIDLFARKSFSDPPPSILKDAILGLITERCITDFCGPKSLLITHIHTFLGLFTWREGQLTLFRSIGFRTKHKIHKVKLKVWVTLSTIRVVRKESKLK